MLTGAFVKTRLPEAAYVPWQRLPTLMKAIHRNRDDYDQRMTINDQPVGLGDQYL